MTILPDPPPTPRCPHCSQYLVEMAAHRWVLEMTDCLAIVVAAYCPNPECRKVLSAQTMLVQQQGQSSIVPPN